MKIFSFVRNEVETNPQSETVNYNEQIQVSADQLNAVVEQLKLATTSLKEISNINQHLNLFILILTIISLKMNLRKIQIW